MSPLAFGARTLLAVRAAGGAGDSATVFAVSSIAAGVWMAAAASGLAGSAAGVLP